MTGKSKKSTGRAFLWQVSGLEGVECFQARAMNHHFGRHAHDAYAIGVIESGIGGNYCRGQTRYFPAGSMVVMNPGEVHTGYAAGERPLTYRMLYIDSEAVLRCLPEKTRRLHFPDMDLNDRYWAARFTNFLNYLEESSDIGERQARFIDIIHKFSIAYGKPQSSPNTGREPGAIRLVKDYLENNYFRTVSIDELAELTGLNRAYLIRGFRKAVGLPPYEYLVHLRVEKAKHLLSNGTPIAQTALEVGFSDQSHMNRHFKKLTGATPRQYALGHYRSRK